MMGPDDYKVLAEIEEARDAADLAFDVDPGLFARAIGDEYSAGWVEQNGLNAAVADYLCDTVCACCGQDCVCDDMEECFTIQTIHAALGSAYYNSPTVAELVQGRENEFPAIAKVCAAARAGGPEDPTAEPGPEDPTAEPDPDDCEVFI